MGAGSVIERDRPEAREWMCGDCRTGDILRGMWKEALLTQIRHLALGVAVGLTLIVLICFCEIHGEMRGERNMKRWQDAWYAANWQSPEVVESRVEVSFQKGQEFQIFVEEHSTPAPPKKTKPAPGVSFVKPNVIYCGDRPCSEFSAKPEKSDN